jgi:hypothetical protein
MNATVAFRETFGHCPDDGRVPLLFDRPIATKDPDKICVAISVTKSLAEGFRVFGSEDLGAVAPLSVPFIAPSRQHANDETKLVRSVDNVVDIFEVGFV